MNKKNFFERRNGMEIQNLQVGVETESATK